MIFRPLALIVLGAFFTSAMAQRTEAHVIIVVNAANPVTAIPRARLAAIFLRQASTWENGQEILPVDQIDKAPARIVFARQVHNQSVGSLKRYWQERIFSGSDSPPPERVTDADVLTYVRSNPGAIGYVTEGIDLGAGVKAITITDPGATPHR